MVTKTIDVHETNISVRDLLALVAEGGEIVLTDEGVPAARLLPIRAPGSPRIPGLHPGAMTMADDFDGPLPDAFWLGDNEAAP